jgi:putative surface-exposed virulence protein
MSRINGRLAPSYLALLVAAGLATPVFAATTTTTIPANTTQSGTVTASPAAGDTHIVEVDGTLSSFNTIGALMIQGSGAGTVIINNDGRVFGRINFGSATGPVTFNNNTGDSVLTQGWHTTGTNSFGSGADTVNNAEAGTIATQGSTTFAFGGGADVFNNAGRLIVDRRGLGTGTFGTLTFTGLETFNNSGLIVLGAKFETDFGGSFADGDVSDGETDDRLVFNGTNFVGSEGGRIALDVELSNENQAGCASAVVTDCVSFVGGSTAGSTLLTITDATPVSAGLGVSITVISGSSAAEHFTLDPNSDHYTGLFGGSMQKGLVAFRLIYDADAMEHQLISVMSNEAVLGVTAASIAHDTWRASTGSWLTRQADLRSTPGGLEDSAALWGRIGGRMAERDLATNTTVAGVTTDYDLSYEQKTSHLVFGADLLRGSTAASSWVAGVMAGFVRSDVEYAATGEDGLFSGFTGGFYGSYVGGPLFVDAVLNLNLLDVAIEANNLDLGEEAKLTNDIKSLGFQAEAGWRVPLSSALFVEPLVGASYVKSEFNDLVLPDGSGSFDYEESYKSLRIGAGARVGLDSQLMGLTTSYALTARYWDEQEGESVSGVSLTRGGSATGLTDTFAGSFTEVAASIHVFGSGGISGFAQLGGQVGDDYQAVDGSVGMRLRW